MGLQATPLTLALVAAVLASLPVAVLAWQARPRPGATPLVALAGSVPLWAGCALASSAGPGATLSWGRVGYVGAALAVLSWFLFALVYANRRDLITHRSLAVVSAPAVATALLVGSGVEGDALLAGVVTGSIPGGRATPGAALYLHLGYSLVLLGVGGYLLLGTVDWRADTGRDRAALLVGVLAPLGATLAPVAGVVGAGPVGFATAAVAFVSVTVESDPGGDADADPSPDRGKRGVDPTTVARDALLDRTGEGVLVLDDGDRLVEANSTAREVLGVADDDVGRHASDALSAYPGLYERYGDADRTREEIGLEDGATRRYFDVRVSPLHDGDDRVGRLLLVREITDGKRRQQELRRQNQRIDRLVSLTSHDLRNPLNVAEGYLDVARETGDTAHLGKVEDSLSLMNRVIEDVLALSRHGRTVTETEPVELSRVARDAWDGVETDGAVLEVRAEARFEADHGRLVRAFESLYRNAVDHAGPDVRVRVGILDEDPGDPAERGFYVEDDGPGIDPGDREEVLQDGYTTAEDGTGLGLSILRAIARAHGWELHVTEGREGGARFEVTGVDPADPEPTGAQQARADGGQ